MSAGTSASSARRDRRRGRGLRRSDTPAPCARHRTGRPFRASTDAPSARRADTARASRSRRTAPSWRRATRADRRAGSASAARRRGGSAIADAVPSELRPRTRMRPSEAPSVTGPERFERARMSTPALPLRWTAVAVAFQSAIRLRSFCLRVSGAVAPSAPGHPLRKSPISPAAGIRQTPCLTTSRCLSTAFGGDSRAHCGKGLRRLLNEEA